MINVYLSLTPSLYDLLNLTGDRQLLVSVILFCVVTISGILFLRVIRKSFSGLGGTNTEQLYILTINLRKNLRSGSPLETAFENARQAIPRGFILLPPSKLAKGAKEAVNYLRNKALLSYALGKSGDCFPDYYVKMIEAGENNDALDEVLLQLAQYLESTRRLNYSPVFKITSQLFFLFVIMSFLATYILPTFFSILEDSGDKMPALTTWVMTIVSFSRNPVFVILAAFTVIATVIFSNTHAGEKLTDFLQLKMPLISKLFLYNEYLLFSKSLGLLIKSGRPLPECISIASSVMGNSIIAARLREAAERSDERLAKNLEKTGIFDEGFLWMVRLGENTDRLAESLSLMGRYYRDELERRWKRAVRIFETGVLFFQGVITGLCIYAIFIPVYSIIFKILKNVKYMEW